MAPEPPGRPLKSLYGAGMALFFSMPQATARSGIQGSQGQQKASRTRYRPVRHTSASAHRSSASPTQRPHIGSQRAASELASRSLNTAEFHKWPPRRSLPSRNRASSTH